MCLRSRNNLGANWFLICKTRMEFLLFPKFPPRDNILRFQFNRLLAVSIHSVRHACRHESAWNCYCPILVHSVWATVRVLVIQLMHLWPLLICWAFNHKILCPLRWWTSHNYRNQFNYFVHKVARDAISLHTVSQSKTMRLSYLSFVSFSVITITRHRVLFTDLVVRNTSPHHRTHRCRCEENSNH